MGQELFWYILFYSWGSCGTEKLRNLMKVTEQERFEPRPLGFTNWTFDYFSFLPLEGTLKYWSTVTVNVCWSTCWITRLPLHNSFLHPYLVIDPLGPVKIIVLKIPLRNFLDYIKLEYSSSNNLESQQHLILIHLIELTLKELRELTNAILS